MDFYAVLEAVARTLSGAELARFSRICKDSHDISAKLLPALSRKIRFEVYIQTSVCPNSQHCQIIFEEEFYQTGKFSKLGTPNFIPTTKIINHNGHLIDTPPKLLEYAKKNKITALKRLHESFSRNYEEAGKITPRLLWFMILDGLVG